MPVLAPVADATPPPASAAGLQELAALTAQHLQAVAVLERDAMRLKVRGTASAWSRAAKELEPVQERISAALVALGLGARASQAQRARVAREQGERWPWMAGGLVFAKGALTREQRQLQQHLILGLPAAHRAAARSALEHAEAALAAAGERFITPPPDSLRVVVDRLPDGQPTAALLAVLPALAADKVLKALAEGIGAGLLPRQLLGQLHQVFDQGVAEAQALVGRDVLRVYRAATARIYAANAVTQEGGVLLGWLWAADLDGPDYPCASCIAMHATAHRPGEILRSHPGCRCRMVPVPAGYQDQLGSLATGPQVFARLPRAAQASVLPRAKLAAYRAGRLRLEDLVGYRHDSWWGGMYTERSLQDIRTGRGQVDPGRFTLIRPREAAP